MNKEKLLADADLSRQEITVSGETLFVHEPNGWEFVEYSSRLKDKTKGREAAIAYLVHRCVRDADGAVVFTEEEAQKIAGGSRRVMIPIISVLSDFVGAKDEDEQAKNG